MFLPPWRAVPKGWAGHLSRMHVSVTRWEVPFLAEQLAGQMKFTT